MTEASADKIGEENRRYRLRRLDDLLEALETCNEHDITHPPRPILEGLIAAGIDPKPTDTTTELIELVLDRQQEFLIKIPLERRKSPRRRGKVDIGAWLREGRRAD
jgi:hypothetical protein